MVITRITQQKRRKDRFSIYIDNAYRLSLSQSQLADAGLRSGDTITEEQIAKLLAASETGKALDQAYGYLAYRNRSRQEVLTYLRRKGYDDELASQLIAELERRHLINDDQFAADWVEMRQELSPRSRRQLTAELRQKGIAPVAIEAALQPIDAAAETTTIITLINQKQLRRRYPERQKLTNYLAGKGFSFDAIKSALEQLEV
jgi:regulatory protein